MPFTDEDGIVFLTEDDVLEINEEQIARYGGGPAGVRDMALVESAVYAPRATFGGVPLYQFPFGMAAVYMVHIIKNHGLLNGNKRTGSVSAMRFLDHNGYGFDIPIPKLRELALLAEAGASKADIARALQLLHIAARGH